MLEEAFSKFGRLQGGKAGIAIMTPKFGTIKTAQIRFEDAEAAEAALSADVVVAGKKLNLSKLRDYGMPPRGAPGAGRGAGPVRYGGNPARGGGRGELWGDCGGREGTGSGMKGEAG